MILLGYRLYFSLYPFLAFPLPYFGLVFAVFVQSIVFNSISSTSVKSIFFNSFESVSKATEDAERKRDEGRQRNLKQACSVKAKEQALEKSKAETQARQNKFFEASSKRNESWEKLADERIKTEKLNRQN